MTSLRHQRYKTSSCRPLPGIAIIIAILLTTHGDIVGKMPPPLLTSLFRKYLSNISVTDISPRYLDISPRYLVEQHFHIVAHMAHFIPGLGIRGKTRNLFSYLVAQHLHVVAYIAHIIPFCAVPVTTGGTKPHRVQSHWGFTNIDRGSRSLRLLSGFSSGTITCRDDRRHLARDLLS